MSGTQNDNETERTDETARKGQRAYIKEIAGKATTSPATSSDEGANVEDFRIELASNHVYRLTGEYLASGAEHADAEHADAEHADEVVQGGMVGLDGIHLTNTAYAYVARLFLQRMRDAHAELHDVLEWDLPDGSRYSLPGVHKDDSELDKMVLKVAREDSLLNHVPVLGHSWPLVAGAVRAGIVCTIRHEDEK
jgi:hypothetical protein